MLHASQRRAAIARSSFGKIEWQLRFIMHAAAPRILSFSQGAFWDLLALETSPAYVSALMTQLVISWEHCLAMLLLFSAFLMYCHFWFPALLRNNTEEGDSPNWLLKRLEVMDVAAGRTYTFPCNAWFGRDMVSVGSKLLAQHHFLALVGIHDCIELGQAPA
eukprot:scaffold106706_cov17-Tisochrysis_lutea.AAC.1